MRPLVAVDVGNSRIKLGFFPSAGGGPSGGELPHPHRTLEIDPHSADFSAIVPWLAPLAAADAAWHIGSVQRTFAARLVAWLRGCGAAHIVLLACDDLPLEVSLPRPDMIGIDRLLSALAANRLRMPDRAAVVVDSGSAITVDLVSPRGAFAGGAILPGVAMSARALHDYTDLLPAVDFRELGEPPPAVGESTEAAIRSGLFWGAVGGVRLLVERFALDVGGPPQVFLTGGAAPALAPLVAADAEYVAHLTLSGIAVAAARSS